MDYKEYTVEDFASDEFFVRWVKGDDADAAHFWTKWIVAHPEKQKQIRQARQLIEAVKYKNRFQLEDELYIEVFEKVAKNNYKANTQKTSYFPRLHKKWFNPLAAMFAMAILAGSLYMRFNFIGTSQEEAPKEPTIVEWLTKEVPFGQRTTLKLSDETTVKLNAGSIFRFPESFSSDSVRKVFLEGEGYFDVSHHSEKPFVIVTNDVQIRVLGTSFNVNTDAKETKVALIDGKLKVATSTGESMVLAPKEMAIFNTSKNNGLVKSTFLPSEVVGWKDGLLQFQRADFQQVINVLEKWYGVKFIVSSEIKTKGNYSGQYDNRPLKEVLEGISIAYHIDFSIEAEVVNIYPKNK